MLSLPARERGLKHGGFESLADRDIVAPRAGAWIETCLYSLLRLTSQVAPRAGAWIETCCSWCSAGGAAVAPRAGAWIETRV